MQEGYAMITGGMMLDGWHQFNGYNIADGAYIGEEVKKLTSK